MTHLMTAAGRAFHRASPPGDRPPARRLRSAAIPTLLATLAAVTPAGRASAAGEDPLTVQTDRGPVHGVSANGVRRFLGVPYAAPPVGPLRWRAPEPPAAWSAPLEATRPGASCPQTLPVVNLRLGDESCLFLNVISPDPPPLRPAPVMVWIHGGGFTVGNGLDDDPTRLVARTGIVAVTLNYRLGPLGFLAHPLLTAEDPEDAAGNLGVQDQQAALRWVKRNIAAFGGDPRRVTIFGESAGGMSVCAQLLSPLARGLFRRAITQSGPCVIPFPPRAVAEAQGVRFADALGCTDAPDVLACLRSKPANEVLAALPSDPTFLFDRSVNWIPTADGVVLPADPLGALRRGRVQRVPVIVGATRDEGRLFVGMAFNLMGHPIAADQWAGEVDGYFGATAGPQVRAQYPLASYPDPGAAFGQAIGDAILACPAVESARLLARHVPVYLYEYDHEPNPFVLPMSGIDLGAFHSADLPYVFAGPVASSGRITFTPAEEQLANVVTGAWTRFAARGHPGGAGLRWPRLTRAGRYLSLDTPSALRRHMKRDVCAFWAELGWSLAGPS
jgi:para-nitrobenzyl esterase